MITIIVAHDLNNIIGNDNKLLWKQSEDLKRFKSLTLNSTIVMGRKTFESIGKPLPNRRNIVMSSKNIPNVEIMNLEDVLLLSKIEDINVIGGGEIYRIFLQYSNRILLTLIHSKLSGDTSFPFLESNWIRISEEFHDKDDRNEYDYSFIEYRNVNSFN